MRFVLTWDELKMIELFFIHMKENAYKQEKGAIKTKNYEITWNPQLILVELNTTELLEKVLLALEGLEDQGGEGQ